MRVVTFLDKMRVPFFVLASLTWGFEITIAFLRSFGAGPIYILLVIVSIFYLIVSTLTASFFLHYGRKLLKTLNDPNTKKAESTSKFRVRCFISVENDCWQL